MPYEKNATEAVVERLMQAGILHPGDYGRAEGIIGPVIEEAVKAGATRRDKLVNRLHYVWTAGHGGATGEGPSGPLRHRPVLARDQDHAREQIEPELTSWDGPIMKITTDPDYAPVVEYRW